MSKSNDILAFRSIKQPFITLWSIGIVEAYGSLLWIDDRPILTIFIDVDEGVYRDTDDPDLPFFMATKPPAQADIIGIVPKFGCITLEKCARYNVRTIHNYKLRRLSYQLEFMPSAIWVGAKKSAVDGSVSSVVASDTRLSGFFGSPGLETYAPYYSGAKKIFESLNNPKSVWVIRGPNHHQIELGDTGWFLSLYTEALETTSATEGHILRSTVNIALHAPTPTTVSEAAKMLLKIEEMISTLSIESFTFQFEWYNTSGLEDISLIWRLGEERSLFRSPMSHQIIIDLRDPYVLREVCKKWFCASSTVGLSRWLFVRALKETDNGLARFVAVSQAFEVLGRDLALSASISKDRLALAVDEIRKVLGANFDEKFVNRISGLIQSSNKSSFRDVLASIIGEAAQRLNLEVEYEIIKFSKIVSDVRNSVIHMNDDNKSKLNNSFSKVNKLSLQLCFWYAVCQVDQMGINIPNINTFLFNNRNARHGLPNEALERN